MLGMTHSNITLRCDGSLVVKFMREDKTDIAEFFFDSDCVAKLFYHANVFNLLNSLNLSIQGGYASILEVSNKITTFMKKTEL